MLPAVLILGFAAGLLAAFTDGIRRIGILVTGLVAAGAASLVGFEGAWLLGVGLVLANYAAAVVIAWLAVTGFRRARG